MLIKLSGERFAAVQPGWFTSVSVTMAVLAISLTIPATVPATDCVNYRDYIHIASTIDLPGRAGDVVVAGGHVFVADEVGLHIFEIGDPENPRPVSELSIPGARCLALRGDHLYVGCEDSDFRTVDVSDLTAPWICDSLTIPTPAHDLELAGDYAYLAVGAAGLEIIDISNPASPDYFTIVDTPHDALDVSIQGDYAYIADRHHLVVIDVSDLPTAPVVVRDRPGPNLVSVAVTKNYAYLMDTNFGLQVYDISDPLDPHWLGSSHESGEGKMVIQGDRLYSGTYPGMTILDISSPEIPQTICKVNTGGIPRGIAVDGDHVYQAINNPGSVDIIDISNPDNPPETGSLMVNGWPWDVDVIYPYAYLSSRFYGLKVIDMTDLGAMLDLGYVAGVEEAKQMILDGDLGYVAGEYNGFYIVDFSVLSDPQLISSLYLGRSTCCVTQGENPDYVYVTNWDGLRIIDVTDPLAPTVAGLLDTEHSAFSVAVAGNYALVATTFELLLIDVENPSQPALIKSFEMMIKHVTVRDDLAYISAIGGLWIYSVENLPELDPVVHVPLSGYPISISFDGNLAYLANGAGGMQILDLTDPADPQRAGSAAHWPIGVFAGKECLFICGSSHLHALPLLCSITAIPDESIAGGSADGVIQLHQNWPNPFNPRTTISYTLTESAVVNLSIHDSGGRLVRTLMSGATETVGLHEVTWRGLDQQGRRVSSGVYMCRIEAGGQVVGRRMILLK
jgi:hypothetical protein